MIISGAGQVNYFEGQVLTYACNTGFDTTAASITCTCDVITTGPNVLAWNCSPNNFQTACLRSKF